MARGLGSVQENGFRVRGRGVGVRRWARDRDGNIPRRAVVGARWTGPALTKPPWGPTDARSTCRTTPVSSWTCMCRGNGECPSLLPLNHLDAQSTCPRSLRSPRSSASNRIIGAKDHASIQMNVAEVSREAAGPTRWVRGRGRADLHVDSQTSGFDPKVLGHLFTTPFLNF